MLDIKFIRENAELVNEAAKKKHIDFNCQELLAVDGKRLELLQAVETARAEHNKKTEEISKLFLRDERTAAIVEMRKAKEAISALEEDLKTATERWKELMFMVPNIPDPSVPDGDSDADNAEVKKWGELPKFDFEPKSHIELMQKLDMVDLERGTKVAGFRGYFLKNDGALLCFAIWQYALEFFRNRGLSPIITPSLIRKESLIGTGYLPQFADEIYKTQDEMYLAGTSEVAMMGMHGGETLEKKDLPKKYLGFSPCFRREAGSYSKDVKGLIRVHEFFKFEQLVLCEASHEESVKCHEEINGNTEAFIESLKIPYRTVLNCGGDLGLGQVKKYDIELWVPGENKYREISSASYFHDFQTRRLNIRYKGDDGKLRFAHSLNCTAIPTPRIIVSLVENYQQKDGSIIVPEVLRKWVGKDVIK